MKWIRDATSRHEREADDRQQRARAHLDRVRLRRARAETRASRLIAVLAISAILGAAWGDSFFAAAARLGLAPAVDTIAVSGATRLAAAEIAAATGMRPGATLDRVDLSALVDQLEDHAWVADAGAVRLPTGTLLVRVEERTAVAWVESGTPPESFAVDASGTPFAPVDSAQLQSLPKLVTVASVTPRLPSERLAEAVRVAYGLSERGLALPAQVSIAAEHDPEGFAVKLAQLPARFVMGREDLDARLDDLVQVVAEQAELLVESSSVDLRFRQQLVLRKAPARDGSETAATARGRAASPEGRPSG